MVSLITRILITLHLIFLYQASANPQQSMRYGMLSSPSQVTYSNRSPEREDFLDPIFKKSRVLFQGNEIRKPLYYEILTEIEGRLDSPYAKGIFRALTNRDITERKYEWSHILKAIMLCILCDSVSIREWQEDFDHFTTIIKFKKWITHNFDSLNRLIVRTQEQEVNKPRQALAALSFDFPSYIAWNRTTVPSDELLFNKEYYDERNRVIFSILDGLDALDSPRRSNPSLVPVRYSRLLKAIDQIRWTYPSFPDPSFSYTELTSVSL